MKTTVFQHRRLWKEPAVFAFEGIGFATDDTD